MDSRTKQIAAVLVIVVIAVGAVGIFLLLPPANSVVVGQLVTPGAPAETPAANIITVGILDPMTEIQGEGAWQGSYLACKEINTAGGVEVNGTTYYFGLIAEDTYEADAQLDISKGTAAATKIIEEDNAQFIIGGFRTESVLAYQETIMDEEILFFGTGAATDDFCTNVGTDYDRYKYFFRCMPISSTALAGELLGFFAYLKVFMSTALAKNITNVAILREDLSWTVPISTAFNYYFPLLGFNIVEEIAYPITAEAADFTTYWSQIDAAGAQIAVPVISAQGGILMMTQYASAQPKCVVAGIDVMSQLESFWTETGGACEYEITLQSTIRTNKTSLTIPFWDAFDAEFGSEPLYTAVGSYDAMYVLLEAITEGQTFDSDRLIPYLEDIDVANPLEAASGHIAFTAIHDLYEGYDPISGTIYSVTLFVQWQADGAKECVSSGGQVYPEYVVTAPLVLPSWGINDA
ncbi:MAG: ABC transporter substrate-binding protein [Candidatus Thorarchaeota archaeon]